MTARQLTTYAFTATVFRGRGSVCGLSVPDWSRES